MISLISPGNAVIGTVCAIFVRREKQKIYCSESSQAEPARPSDKAVKAGKRWA